ncbi:MAG: thiopurine S-methyltransferase [Myxococcota bacterium]
MTDSETNDAPTDWLAFWEAGDTGWHEDQVHPAIVEHAKGWKRVLVPLCGATVDMAWMAERDHEVVGIELSELACRRVFDDWGKTPAIDTHTADGTSYERYHASGLTLLRGDMLALAPSHAGTFDAVWDRGSLVALSPEQRRPYLDALSRVAAGAQLLLVTFEYQLDAMKGPPFSISPALVRDSFDEVEQVHEDRDLTFPTDPEPLTVTRRWYRARIR